MPVVATVADQTALPLSNNPTHPPFPHPFPSHPSLLTCTLSTQPACHFIGIKRMISIGEQGNATIRKRRTNEADNRIKGPKGRPAGRVTAPGAARTPTPPTTARQSGRSPPR